MHLSTLCLLTIGTFDLVTTLMWLNVGHAEGNAIFAYFAERGSLPLVGAKLAFLFGPVLMLELARRYRPTSAEIGTWFAALAYAYLYVSHLRQLV
ncbi:MAG: DUF5658 family protein [Fimbriimonas sp.]